MIYYLTRDKSGETKLWDTRLVKRDKKLGEWYNPYGNCITNRGDYSIDYHLFDEAQVKWEDEPIPVFLEVCPWHSNEEMPEFGGDILTYIWYDGPHYSHAWYDEDKQRLIFDEKDESGKNIETDLSAIEKWMYIPKA